MHSTLINHDNIYSYSRENPYGIPFLSRGLLRDVKKGRPDNSFQSSNCPLSFSSHFYSKCHLNAYLPCGIRLCMTSLARLQSCIRHVVKSSKVSGGLIRQLQKAAGKGHS